MGPCVGGDVESACIMHPTRPTRCLLRGIQYCEFEGVLLDSRKWNMGIRRVLGWV